MNIKEINGEVDVKLSPCSITVKRDGKTFGVVRNVYNFMELQPNKATNYFKTIRKFEGLHKRITRSDFYISDGNLYYICKRVPFVMKGDESENWNNYIQAVKDMESEISVLYIGAVEKKEV